VPPEVVELPEQVIVGDIEYRVVRSEPDEGDKANIDFKGQLITIAPWLRGEDTIWAFLHELTHAMVHAVGQHADNDRNEEYVTNIGYLLVLLTRGNPELVEYLVDPEHVPVPHEIAIGPVLRWIEIVPDEAVGLDRAGDHCDHSGVLAHSSTSEDDYRAETTIEISADTQPHQAAREVLNGLLYCGLMLQRSPKSADSYYPRVFPVSGMYNQVLRRNPEVVDVLLSGPAHRRAPSLRAVPEPHGTTLA